MPIILNPRDQKIFFYRIFGSTHQSIANEFGISKSRVQQICSRGEAIQTWRAPYYSVRHTPFGDYDPYFKENCRLRTMSYEIHKAAEALLEPPHLVHYFPLEPVL